MKFYYIKEERLHEEMKKDLTKSLPVAHAQMRAEEAVARMQRKSGHPPIHFKGSEHYYIRFDVSGAMNDNIDLHSGALGCLPNESNQGWFCA